MYVESLSKIWENGLLSQLGTKKKKLLSMWNLV